MDAIARWSVVALDSRDPDGLARFYSELTGWPIAPPRFPDWVELVSGGPVTIACQLAPDHQPPQWPGGERPQQLHLDFEVPDLDEGERAVLALGATKAQEQPGTNFRVYLDPAGHPFCLCWDRPGE